MAKLETLIDNFDDNSLDEAKWSPNGQVTESSGRLNLESSSILGGASVVSASSYTLVDSYVFVKIIDAGTQISGCAFYPIGITDWDTLFCGWSIVEGVITVEAFLGGEFSDDYDADTYRFLRIRVTDGVIYYDYSANGSSWTTAFSESVGEYDMTSVFTLCSLDNNTSSITASIDDYNVVTGGTGSEPIPPTVLFTGPFIAVRPDWLN